MGRRALPKVDTTLDISRHYYELEDVKLPIDRVALFGREVPFEVEVGSGKGLFMTTASGNCPERDFLGIDCWKVRAIRRGAVGKTPPPKRRDVPWRRPKAVPGGA